MQNKFSLPVQQKQRVFARAQAARQVTCSTGLDHVGQAYTLYFHVLKNDTYITGQI